MIKSIFYFLIFSFSVSKAASQKTEYYYGEKVQISKDHLHNVIASYHIPKSNQPDQIATFCHEDVSPGCFRHTRLGYKLARKYLFGLLHLDQAEDSSYQILGTYCDVLFHEDDFPKNKTLGEMKIPSAYILNTEHSWPQSQFGGPDKSFQKSDLHALFPTDSQTNSVRGSHPFGDVVEETKEICAGPRFGLDSRGNRVFEPSARSRGNIARALFYFSTRYKMSIPSTQEEVLRRWHKLDPVDDFERERNNGIFQIQKVRNPFIDHPEWVAKIENF